MAYGRILYDLVLGSLDNATSTVMAGLSYGQRSVHAKSKRGVLPQKEARRLVELRDQGGYEPHNTPVVKGTIEQLAETAKHLLQTLQP